MARGPYLPRSGPIEFAVDRCVLGRSPIELPCSVLTLLEMFDRGDFRTRVCPGVGSGPVTIPLRPLVSEGCPTVNCELQLTCG